MFVPENLSMNEDRIVAVQRSLRFLTCQEFEKQYGLNPVKVPEISIDQLMDEGGNQLKGVLLPDEQNPGRRVLIERRVGTGLSQALLSGADQIRPQQGTHMRDVCHADEVQSRPRAMKGNPPSMQQLEEWLEKARAEARSAPEPAEQQELPPEAPLSSLAAADVADSEDEVVQDQTATAAFQHYRDAAVQEKKPKKGKGRGKGAGKKRKPSSSSAGDLGSSKAPRVGNAPTTNNIARSGEAMVHEAGNAAPLPNPDARVTGTAEAREGLAASVSGRSLRTPLDKLCVQAEKYLQLLDASKALDGQSLGNELYQAQRLTSSLEEREVGRSEVITLKAQVALVNQCKKLAAAVIGQLSTFERNTMLQVACASVPVLPVSFKVGVFLCSIREFSLEGDASIMDFVGKVWPFPSGLLAI